MNTVAEHMIELDIIGKLVQCLLVYMLVFVIFCNVLFNLQEPISPTPTIVMTGSNPLSSAEVAVKMDDCDMILDDGSIEVSLALAVAFSLFHVYQVHYPKPLRKTLAFLEAFVFQMKSAVPLTVQKLFNSLQ